MFGQLDGLLDGLVGSGRFKVDQKGDKVGGLTVESARFWLEADGEGEEALEETGDDASWLKVDALDLDDLRGDPDRLVPILTKSKCRLLIQLFMSLRSSWKVRYCSKLPSTSFLLASS